MTGFDDVNQKFKALMAEARAGMTERAVTQMLIRAGAYSASMTPVATSNLLNSQYRSVRLTSDGIEGEVGYTADYAKYVHDAPGKLLGTGTKRYPARLGYVWDPGAEPQFLAKGAQEMIDNDFRRIIRENMTL